MDPELLSMLRYPAAGAGTYPVSAWHRVIEALLAELEEFLGLKLSRDPSPGIKDEISGSGPAFCVEAMGFVKSGALDLSVSITLGTQACAASGPDAKPELYTGAYVFLFQESTRITSVEGDFLILRYNVSDKGRWEVAGWAPDEFEEFEEVPPPSRPA